MAYIFKRLTGRRYNNRPAGIVDIPFLGAKVGELDNWTLTRRGDIGPDAGLYDLRALFSFVSEALWHDGEYPKRITINLTPTKQYRLEQLPDQRTVLQGKSLLMESVRLVSIEK